MRTILIGIDDTDNLTSPGTGRIARDLCAELTKKGLRSLGVTRHQFLFDKAIPFTSHNSGACIAIESSNGIGSVDFVFDYIAEISAEGSDPGVCIAFSDDVPQEVFRFGEAAQKEILKIEESFKLAKGKGIKLHGLGGDCLGVIGALASVGLRAQGCNGRYIDLPGLRQLPDRASLNEYEKIGIEIRYRIDNREPEASDAYDNLGWARPCLIAGKPVLTLEWSEKENAWIPVDRKKDKPSQHSKK